MRNLYKKGILLLILLFTVGWADAQAIHRSTAGALNGVFSVSDSTQVCFSQGNLQYIGSAATPYWKFADHQWDYLGDNGQGSDSPTADRDLFGWGTSGYNHGANAYQPWSTNGNTSDYYAYGSYTYNLYDQTGQADWGYNAISNGGNTENSGWRTLTTDEWIYVFNTRNTTSGIRWAKGTVNGVNGTILLPDNWTASVYTLNNTNGGNYGSNTISAEDWANTLEANGAVFLPAAGYRDVTSVRNVGSNGNYWSASYYTSGNAYSMNFSGSSLNSQDYDIRFLGRSVRLVRSADPQTHTYIDLGLPSGTLWATCNVGANAPEEYGDYFAWGETQTKDNYNWSTYQYCMGSNNTMTKYCNNADYGYNGFTDDLTVLQSGDDAATANWGADWRMPTKEEFEELYNNTTMTWTQQNGVNGRLFTASNGNSLFLPAAGHLSNDVLNASGSEVYYWSNSLYTDSPYNSWGIYSLSFYCDMAASSRELGRSVRPVRSVQSFISATANPAEGGTITGAGSYEAGTTCTLTSTANEGYTFINWTENGEVVSTENPYTFVVTGDRELVANFEESTTYLTSLSDDFNDGVINPELWFYSGNNVYEEDGLMKMEQNITDQIVCLWTTPMSVTPNNQIFIDRSFIVHRGGSVYYAGCAIEFNGDNGIHHVPSGIYWDGTSVTVPEELPDFIDITYGYDEYGSHHGTYLEWAFDNEAHGVRLCDAVFDTWQTEKVVVDIAAGTVSYYLDDAFIATVDIPGLQTFQIDYYNVGFRPYGWWTGHYHYMDYININTNLDTTYTINASANPVEGGTVSGGGEFQFGQTCTLTAITNSGYIFNNWTENGEVVSTENPYTFTVTGNRELVANFEEEDDDNLVFNGDFELGNTGFSTDYIYGNTGSYNHYYIGHDIAEMWSWDSPGFPVVDHTSGEGLFMMVDGALQDNSLVWSQTVTVTPNTDYVFSAWFLTNNVGQIRFEINDVQGPDMTTPEGRWVWEQQSMTWNSGSNTEATLKIINRYAESGGYDYCIDDIYFGPIHSIPTEGLIAYYPFNGNANDESGNENHGTLQGNVPQLTTDRFGNENSAYLFGGVYNKGWIRVPNSSTLALDNALSISFWVNFTDFTGENGWGSYTTDNNVHAVVCKGGDNGSHPGFNAIMGPSGDSLHIWSFNRYPDFYNVGAYCHGYEPGQWLHCVVTVDDTLSRMYVNGVLCSESIGDPANFSNANAQDMTIGVMNAGSWYPFNGKIDDVFLYNRALTPEEVQMLYGTNVTEIAAMANPEEGGTIAGAGTYFAGETCTLTATPSLGYTFINWTENGEVVSTENPYTFTVTGDRGLVANFEESITYLTSLSDDFNDGVIDPELWTYTGNAVLEEEGLLKLQQNVTDQDVHLRSVDLSIPENGKVNMNRRFLIHRASNYYHGRNIILLNGDWESSLRLEYVYTYHYDGSYQSSPKTGVYFITRFDGVETEVRLCDFSFDTWLTEYVEVDFAAGTLSYYLDSLVAEVPIPGLAEQSVSHYNVQYAPWGWWTGHYHNMDYVNINPLSEGLIAYYPFDGDANDYSGNEYHATPYNNYQYEDGLVGESIAVEGQGYTGSSGGHVMLPQLDFGASTSVTLNLWVKALGLSHNDGETYINFGEDTETDRLYIMHHPDQIRFVYHDSEISIPNEDSYNANWVMYSLTLDENGTLKAYVNGISVGEESVTFNGINTSLAALGRHWWYDTSTRFIGSFDEVRIYNRALSPEEVQMLYGYNVIEITATANPEEGGTVSGAGLFSHGDTCTLIATSNASYTFINWTENGEVVSTEATYSFTVTSHRKLVANFEGSTLNPEEDLVAYYPFDGDVNDYSGNGNHGTIIGNVVPATDRHGNVNGAYRFPGEAFNYISVPDAECLHLSSFTLSAWVYTDADNYGSGYLINKGRDINNGSYHLTVSSVSAFNDYYGENGAGVSENPQTHEWHMITGTVEGDQARYYLDGVLMDERTLSNPFSYGNSEPLTLGCHYYSGVPSHWAYTLLGVLDEVRIYSRVFTPQEVMQLYNYSEGSLSGLFSVSETTQVNFSKGNLQYQASTNTWRFAENQWDCVGADNANISETYDGWIDLFGWGTSGYDHGANAYQPWSTSQNNYDYLAYGDSGASLSDYTGQADWGYNAISNGGNQEGLWHTLSHSEWDYLINNRPGTTLNGVENARHAKAVVNGIAGLILFPDHYSHPDSIAVPVNINEYASQFTDNEYTIEQWYAMEDAGAVFLPTAGIRNGGVPSIGSLGIYWSTTPSGSSCAHRFDFTTDYVVAWGIDSKWYGYSVRLVKNVMTTTCSIEAVPNPAEGGTVTGAGTYFVGETCTLTAIPNESYTFINWTENGEVISTEATYSFIVTMDRNLVANFLPPLNITAEASPSEYGSVSGAGAYDYGTECTLTASANEGYTFMYWTEDDNQVSSDANYTFTVTGDRHLVAHFCPMLNITASVIPEEGGAIVGVGEYDYNAECTLTATANEGYTFINWTENGEVVSTESEYSFVVVNDRNLVANFVEGEACAITFNLYDSYGDGWNGNRLVVNTDYGVTHEITLNGGSSGTQTLMLVDGHHITLTWINGSWTYECSFTMSYSNGNVIYTGGNLSGTSFEFDMDCEGMPATTFDIVATANPDEGGTITGAGEYVMGTECIVTAVANEGWTFVNWTENGNEVSTEASYTFTVTGNRNLMANFLLPLNITAEASPSEYGSVSGVGAYDYGTECTLTASANEGYTFMYWTEDDNQVSSDANYTFTVTSDRHLVAHFCPKLNITVSVLPEEGGAVVGVGEYDYNAECTLTATANEGYTFINWTENGEVVSTESEYSFVVVNDRNLVANFVEGEACAITFNLYDSYGDGWNGNRLVVNTDYGVTHEITLNGGSSGTQTLMLVDGHHITLTWINGSWTYECSFTMSYSNGNVIYTGGNLSGTSFEFDMDCEGMPATTFDIVATANPDEGGTIIGAGEYVMGTECTLTATPIGNYIFVNWTENGSEVSTEASYTFTVTGDRNLVANFLHPFAITVSAVPEEGGTVTGAGEYNNGTECTLTASANEGYAFMYWTEDGIVVSSDVTYSFIVTDDHNFVAYFAENSQTISLGAGWNWISTYIEQEGIDGLTMLEEGLNSNGVMIKSQTDGFLSYANGMWIGTLDAITNEKMYLVNTSEASEVTLTGAVAHLNAHPITLNPNWTWVGYPSPFATDINIALANLNPAEGDMMKSQSGFATFMAGSGWFGSLNTLNPGMGLMYQSHNSQAVTLTYSAGMSRSLRANVTAENNHWVPDIHAYPNNMSIMAVVELNGMELQDERYELAVFSGNECRGSVRLMYVEPMRRYVAFLSVAGEEDAELCLALYDTMTDEAYFNTTDGLNFEANAVVGSLSSPYVARFGGAEELDEFGAETVILYPNPVSAGYLFQIELPAESKGARVSIINALGSVVSTTDLYAKPATLRAPDVPGVYTVRVMTGKQGTYCRKLIVK